MIRADLTNEQYHASDAISSSDVKAVITSSIFHWKNKKFKETASMALGSAVHDMVLEGGKSVICGPETRRGNAWKDAEDEAKALGKLLLPEGEYMAALEIADAVRADPTCRSFLDSKDTKIEHSLFAVCPETDLKLRCRPDIYSPEKAAMADLKTTVDASPSGFNRQIYNYRYDVQAAFYIYVSELCGWEVRNFGFMAVENGAPYAAHMHVMSSEALELAQIDMMRGLRQIAEAETHNKFETGWGSITMVYPPSWLKSE